MLHPFPPEGAALWTDFKPNPGGLHEATSIWSCNVVSYNIPAGLRSSQPCIFFHNTSLFDEIRRADLSSGYL
jgi:hypothetical protein